MNSVRSGFRLTSLKVLVGARNVWRPIKLSVWWEAVSSYLDLAVYQYIRLYGCLQHCCSVQPRVQNERDDYLICCDAGFVLNKVRLSEDKC